MRGLIGARITAFGMNFQGEFYLHTDRGDEFVIAKDELSEICLYEIERKPA